MTNQVEEWLKEKRQAFGDYSSDDIELELIPLVEQKVIGEIVKLIDEKIKTFTITDDDESYYSFSVLREIRAIIGRDRGGDVGRRPEDEDIIDSDSQFIPVIPYDAVMNIPIYIQP